VTIRNILLGICSLALVACEVEPTPLTLVPADDELHAVLLQADQVWEDQGVDPDRIHIAEPGSAGYPVEWADADKMKADCGGYAPAGCAQAEQLLISTELDAPLRTAIHELGHLIRGVIKGGAPDHLDEDVGCTVTPVDGVPWQSPHVMCPYNIAGAPVFPSSTDVEFVCSSPHAGC
jgi:hypothetical protein